MNKQGTNTQYATARNGTERNGTNETVHWRNKEQGTVHERNKEHGMIGKHRQWQTYQRIQPCWSITSEYSLLKNSSSITGHPHVPHSQTWSIDSVLRKVPTTVPDIHSFPEQRTLLDLLVKDPMLGNPGSWYDRTGSLVWQNEWTWSHSYTFIRVHSTWCSGT